MNSYFESPVDFNPEKRVGEYKICYKNLREIAQGSPLVGNLCINEKCLPDNLLFGGPFLCQVDKIIIPLFIRKFCVAGFRLCVIDMGTLNYKFYGKILNLIFLDSIRGNEVDFFLDLNKTRQDHIIIGNTGA